MDFSNCNSLINMKLRSVPSLWRHRSVLHPVVHVFYSSLGQQTYGRCCDRPARSAGLRLRRGEWLLFSPQLFRKVLSWPFPNSPFTGRKLSSLRTEELQMEGRRWQGTRALSDAFRGCDAMARSTLGVPVRAAPSRLPPAAPERLLPGKWTVLKSTYLMLMFSSLFPFNSWGMFPGISLRREGFGHNQMGVDGVLCF